ncbi:hypothetical protein MPTK1_6g12500 [Marchantia polymorpha subsp. ruderalis]|uniref:Uncharacterized protein n=2 Tax=Marchantia polymorpha TaxID=3197 RepID=A0AAF6BRB4_MARPO|nr:hypothetical protein MARPO_0059s0097 [Marchantia polymorpha]BBN14548.1 hypothetical protein Mp_6g12500 [Marchantia polymorpha subsp. ruderalis]|eukprot:PTQ37172.1 hypothetical protein MARPO_0059s0097 [Marchantia polymorpha]
MGSAGGRKADKQTDCGIDRLDGSVMSRQKSMTETRQVQSLIPGHKYCMCATDRDLIILQYEYFTLTLQSRRRREASQASNWGRIKSLGTCRSGVEKRTSGPQTLPFTDHRFKSV